jgi:hypothetical protein
LPDAFIPEERRSSCVRTYDRLCHHSADVLATAALEVLLAMDDEPAERAGGGDGGGGDLTNSLTPSFSSFR